MNRRSARWPLRAMLSGVVIFAGLLSVHAFQNQKSPVPSTDAQAKVMELIREVFKKEYEGAKTSAEKVALAEELLKRGVQSSDATERFVLLRVARDMAALAGEAEVACQSVNEMARLYAIDPATTKKEALSKIVDRASTTQQHEALAQQATLAVDDAIADDDYDTAKQLAEMAQAAARKARNTTLVAAIDARLEEIDRISKSAGEVKQALAALEKNPGDPKANLSVGIYYCLLRGNWEKGLPMLALAGDDTYSPLARKELMGVTSANEQVALADAWWGLIEKSDVSHQRQLTARAAHWYDDAVSQLSGLTKLRVEKRLGEIAAAEKAAEEEEVDDGGGKDPDKPTRVVRKKATFEGTWRDCFNSTIEFKVEDKNVVGTYKNVYKSRYGDYEYTNYEGRIVGKLSRNGRTLSGQWARSPTYSGPEDAGALIFTLNKDGTAFSGTFTAPAANKPNPWTGMRLQ